MNTLSGYTTHTPIIITLFLLTLLPQSHTSTGRSNRNIHIHQISQDSSEMSSGRQHLLNPMALGLAEDSFFQGATVNKINRTMKKHNNRKDKIRDKYQRRMDSLKSNEAKQKKQKAMMSAKSLNDVDDLRKRSSSSKFQSIIRSGFTIPIRSNNSVINIGSFQSMELDIHKTNKENAHSKSASIDLDEDSSNLKPPQSFLDSEVVQRRIDLSVRDRIHAAPDDYEGTEATKKRFSRIFSPSPPRLVPVIGNCNRPAVEFFFKRNPLQDVNETLLDPERPVNEHNLEISDRLDAANVQFCPFMEMACCSNEEMDQLRNIIKQKEQRLGKFKDFINNRHFIMFEKDMITTAQVFVDEDKDFLGQCLNDDPEFIKSILLSMSTTVFENGLRISHLVDRLKTLNRYLACKICDGNDNHRTFTYQPHKGELTLSVTPEVALHLVRIKLLELEQAVYFRKISIISRLVLCKLHKRSSFGLNENANGAIRWTQNFYRKCKGELIYTLPHSFDRFSDLTKANNNEDLNEYLAFDIDPVVYRKRAKNMVDLGFKDISKVEDIGITLSNSCLKAIFETDSHIINFKDSFDLVQLTDLDFQIISRFWKFLEGKDRKAITKQQWEHFGKHFDFHLRDFLHSFKDDTSPAEKLGPVKQIQANDLIPFVFSPLSSDPTHGSYATSLKLSEFGVEYDLIIDFERIVSKSDSRALVTVMFGVLALLTFF